MNIDLQKINKNAIHVCEVLKFKGFQAYIVGGCVRDLLLGHEPKDWDICTDAKPEQVIEMFTKTYPTGLQHGTVTVEWAKEHFEVTTFRVEGEYLDGRRPSSVEFVSKVEDDLARRDLTINAMAFDPTTKELIDPFGGQLDLAQRRIRCVGRAEERFTEDGLRIMRVARFTARFGYAVDELTLTAMKACISTLQKVSIERIKDELWKTLQTSCPSIGLNILHECHVLSMIELEWQGYRIREAIGNVDVCVGADPETKCAVMCSWFAPHTLEKLCSKLKMSNVELKKMVFLLNTLDQFSVFLRNKTPYAARCFLAYIRNNAPDHHSHSIQEFYLFSDAIGLEAREDMEQFQNEIVWGRSDLRLNGNDLIDSGVPAGPEMKKLLNRAYELILEFPEKNERSQLLTFVQQCRA